MRLIDADKIRNKLKQKEINPATIFINEVLIGLLDDAPTVDAVWVVRCRCKDCKHWTDENGGFCDIWDHYISNEEFFCGCGERRSSDEKKA